MSMQSSPGDFSRKKNNMPYFIYKWTLLKFCRVYIFGYFEMLIVCYEKCVGEKHFTVEYEYAKLYIVRLYFMFLH